MLIAAAVCPQPPILLDGVAGAVDPVPELRAACAEAAAWLIEQARDVPESRVIVVGGGPATGEVSPELDSPVAGFRGTASSSPALPPSLAIGRQLLGAAGGRADSLVSIAWGSPPNACAAAGGELVGGATPVALLVLADGSACRTVKAPGYFDPRAADLDERIVGALAGASAEALLALDPRLTDELQCQGREALQALAGAAVADGLGDRPTTPRGAGAARRLEGRVIYQDDPFGVQYVVATWHTPTAP